MVRVAAAHSDAEQLLVVGTLADVVEDQFQRLFEALGVGPVHFLPARSSEAPLTVGPGTRILLAQPWLSDTVSALTDRGATLLRAPFPLGAEGTRAWLLAATTAWGIAPAAVHEVIAAPFDRARRAPGAAAGDTAGTQRELPSRFAARTPPGALPAAGNAVCNCSAWLPPTTTRN